MTRTRLLALVMAAVGVLAAAVLPVTPAAAAREAGTTVLTGVCPWFDGAPKDLQVSTELRSGSLLSPYRLYDDKGWTGATLIPYEVTASGEGLKSRHLLPGTYTRKGRAEPPGSITCSFGGTTADGVIGLQVTGTVQLKPRPRR